MIDLYLDGLRGQPARRLRAARHPAARRRSRAA
jgi:hypothetical protein